MSDNKWIPWCGGDCPVQKGTLVDVVFRGKNYGERIGIPALAYGFMTGSEFWKHDSTASDIIAWRMHHQDNWKQRAEAAEAKLAELKKQKPCLVLRPFGENSQLTFIKCESDHPFAVELFTRASPNAVPVKLSRIIQTGYTHDEITAMCNVRNDDVAAIRAAGYEVKE